MNLEAINKWLDEEYGCSYTKLEELHDFYFEKYCDLKQENKQLKENYERIYNENCKLREEHNITDISLLDENYKIKDNWNKLKEWVKVEHREDVIVINLTWKHATGKFLNKMQEIEQGSDSNE